MQATGLRHITLLTLWLAILVVIGACSHTPQTALDAMDRAESLMEQHPDSALAILETVNPKSLRSKADKARRSLLTTMAVDKNYIDTTDFRILQPALDYYLSHGTPDQRLKTRYYEGRIRMNQGDDNKALEAFLRASEDSAACCDSLALARLYMNQGIIFYRQNSIKSYLTTTQKAEQFYLCAGDSLDALRCRIKILEGANLDNDSILAFSSVKIIEDNLNKFSNIDLNPLQPLIIHYISFDKTETLKNHINKWLKDYSDEIEKDADLCMNIALAFDKCGDHQSALIYAEKAKDLLKKNEEGEDLDNLIKLNAILSQIYENNNLIEKSLAAYKDYVEYTTKQDDYLFNSGVLFTKERHDIEIERHRETTKSLTTILLSLICFLIALLLIFIMFLNGKIQKKQRLIRQSEHKLINEKHNKEIIKSQNLLLQHQLDEVEKRDLEFRNLNLQQKISELESEKSDLKDILEKNPQLPAPVQKAVVKRLKILDDFFVHHITGDKKLGKEFYELIESIHNKKDGFFKFICNSYEDSHPKFMQTLRQHGLTESEITYVCLLIIGVSNKQIEIYTQSSNLRGKASKIRAKLGIPSKSTTLSIYLREMMER